MPLTPQEEQELAALEAEEAQQLAQLQNQKPKKIENTEAGYAKAFQDLGRGPEQVKKAIQVAGTGMAGAASPAANFLQRVGASGLTGIASDQARSPSDALRSFLTGAAAQALPEGLGKGLKKVGDVAQQIGLGMRKYVPGLGEATSDLGIRGTSGSMQKNVANQMSQAGQALDDTAAAIPGTPVSGPKLAQEMWDEASRPHLSGGITKPSLEAKKDLTKIADYIEDVASRGDMTGEAARGYAKSASNVAYNRAGNVPEVINRQLAQMEQAKTSALLKAADPTGKYAEAAKKYSILSDADRALNKDTTLPSSLFRAVSTPVNMIPILGDAVPTYGAKAAISTGRAVEKLPEALRLFQAAKE